MGFLSVVHYLYDGVKLLVIASSKILCVSGLGIMVGIYRLILLIVTLTPLSLNVVYRIFCFLFDVCSSSSNPSPLVIFLNDLQNPDLYSRGRCPLINPLSGSV